MRIFHIHIGKNNAFSLWLIDYGYEECCMTIGECFSPSEQYMIVNLRLNGRTYPVGTITPVVQKEERVKLIAECARPFIDALHNDSDDMSKLSKIYNLMCAGIGFNEEARAFGQVIRPSAKRVLLNHTPIEVFLRRLASKDFKHAIIHNLFSNNLPECVISPLDISVSDCEGVTYISSSSDELRYFGADYLRFVLQ